VIDTFPLEDDLNFGSMYGLESEDFTMLDKYLKGNNVGHRRMPLNFPVFFTVTPKTNNTVERAICVWISEFSRLVPPEMDRHLGFLEIPQPLDPNIEVTKS